MIVIATFHYGHVLHTKHDKYRTDNLDFAFSQSEH